DALPAAVQFADNLVFRKAVRRCKQALPADLWTMCFSAGGRAAHAGGFLPGLGDQILFMVARHKDLLREVATRSPGGHPAGSTIVREASFVGKAHGACVKNWVAGPICSRSRSCARERNINTAPVERPR